MTTARKPAPVVHFEIGCKNLASTSKFYAELLGWQYLPPSGGPPMAMLGNIGPYAQEPTTGIGGHIHEMPHPPFQYVTFYAQVDNLAETLKLAESLGGSTLIPPTEVPGMGSFAWFKDPEGNAVGLWKPLMPG